MTPQHKHKIGYWVSLQEVNFRYTECETVKPAPGEEGRKEIFYLMTHSTHFIYGYMVSDIW